MLANRWIAGCSGLLSEWDRDEIRQYQSRQLRALVQHAYERVPYYRRLFDRTRLRPDQVQTLDDLARIPPTSRTDLQGLPAEDIVARGFDPKKLVVHRTGGSSGQPLNIRRTWFEDRLLQACRLRVLFRLGMRPTDRRAAVVEALTTHVPLYMRAGVLRYDEIHCLWPPDRILARLRETRPDVLRGYPSALAWVAADLTDADRQMIRPRFITTDSEVMTTDMRERIRQGFRAPVIDFYDSHEFNMIAWECPSSGRYHVSETTVIAEVVRDGRPAEPGEEGEFVGTALHSWAMPFIRYRLQDLVTRGATSSILTRVQGRVMDRFLLPDGRIIHPYTLVSPLLSYAPWLRQYQLIQERTGRIRVKLVPVPGLNPEPEVIATVGHILAGALGAGASVDVEVVDHIRPGPNGKFRAYYRA